MPTDSVIAFRIHYSSERHGYYAEIFEVESGKQLRLTRSFKSISGIRRHAESVIKKLRSEG